MFKLFYNKEKNINEKPYQDPAEINKAYIKFNIDFINFCNYHYSLFAEDKNNKKEEKETDTYEYYINFISKFLSILEINKKINSKIENFSFIYLSIINYLKGPQENEKTYFIFFKPFENIFYDKDDNNPFKFEQEMIIQLKDLVEKICLSSDGNFTSSLFSIFIKTYIPKFIDNLYKNYLNDTNEKNIISFLIYFVSYYDNVLFKIYKDFFENIMITSKAEIFNEKIVECLIKSTSFKFNEQQKDYNLEIEQLISLLSKHHENIILQILSIISTNKDLLNYYTMSLIKTLLVFLSNEVHQTPNALEKFRLIKKAENIFFNSENNNFFFKNSLSFNYSDEFTKIVYDILCKDTTNINVHFIKAFDDIMRNEDKKSEIDKKSKLVFSYFNVIPQYETFEWMYIHSVINRAVDENFDFIKEKQMIEQIEIYSKEKYAYSYKMQTLISNIKMSRNDKVSLIVFPFHSYHLFNSTVKPNYNINLIKMFKDCLKVCKFPENSQLIFQQGYVEFYSKRKNFLSSYFIKGDILQYSILTLINDKKVPFDTIKKEIGIKEEIIRFLLGEMVNSGIVIFDDENDIYSINGSYGEPKENNLIDIRVNYEVFFEGGSVYTKYAKKMTEKYQVMIWDCYIIKQLKKIKKSTLEDIYTHLNNVLPTASISYLTKEKLENTLSLLVTKGLLSKEKNIFKYN